jgi:CheY-like chemotaxis protein
MVATPDMNGYEAARKLRQIPISARTTNAKKYA